MAYMQNFNFVSHPAHVFVQRYHSCDRYLTDLVFPESLGSFSPVPNRFRSFRSYLSKIWALTSCNFRNPAYALDRPIVLRQATCPCLCPLYLEYDKGIARTQSPTIKNYALELPTFGVIVGVSLTGVQWKGLTLEEPPS